MSVFGSLEGWEHEAPVSGLGGRPTHESKDVATIVRSYEGKLRVYLMPGYTLDLDPGESVWGEAEANQLERVGVFTLAEMTSKVLGGLPHLANRPDKIHKQFLTPSTRYAA